MGASDDERKSQIIALEPTLWLLATFGEAGAAQNAAPLPQGERHLSHLAMNSPSTLLTICRGDTRPVPCQRHREARP